jgi:hypothetical protein
MSKLEDKLAASIKPRRQAKTVATKASPKPASSVTPDEAPAVTPAAAPAGPGRPPHPRRVWPD